MILKSLLRVSALLACVSAGALTYGIVGPWYEPCPLAAPCSFASEQTQTYTFTVERSGVYLVDVELVRAALSDEEEAAFFEASGTEDAISASNPAWSLRRNGELVAEGSAGKERHAPFRSSDVIGLTIGRAGMERGRTYRLHLRVQSPRPRWDEASPTVLVRLHPADLEYLTVLKLLGGAGSAVALPFLFVLTVVAAWRRARARASTRSAGSRRSDARRTEPPDYTSQTRDRGR